MNDTLKYVVEKYSIDVTKPSPIEIPNVGRVNLAMLMGELGFKVGAEIGVEKGIYSEIICQYNTGVKLYCIDIWASYAGYVDLKGNRDADANYYQAYKTLKEYGATLIKEFSMDAVRHFPDESLDFVYIDADHTFVGVTNDLWQWSKKVRRGGIIAGHDYRPSYTNRNSCHVIEALAGYTKSYRIDPWFILGTKAKVDGQVRERSRSFFWVKP